MVKDRDTSLNKNFLWIFWGRQKTSRINLKESLTTPEKCPPTPQIRLSLEKLKANFVLFFFFFLSRILFDFFPIGKVKTFHIF